MKPSWQQKCLELMRWGYLLFWLTGPVTIIFLILDVLRYLCLPYAMTYGLQGPLQATTASQVGIRCSVLQWFHHRLPGQVQTASLVECSLSHWPLNYRDPQGTVLSTMLFSNYMKPLGVVFRSFGVRCHQDKPSKWELAVPNHSGELDEG